MLTLAGVALSAGGAYAYFWENGRSDVIAAGVRVSGIDVGGLRATRARALLHERLVSDLARPLHLTYGARSFVLDPAQAGLRVDVQRMLSIALDASRRGSLADRFFRDLRGRRLHASVPLEAALSQDALARYVEHVASVVDRPARQARVVPTVKTLRVVPERDGVAVRRDALRAALESALLRPGGPRTVAIPVRAVRPRWTAATLPRRYPAFIVVDRNAFALRFFRGLRLYKTYPIAVGRAGLETPAGLYRIDDKQVNPSWHVPKSAWAGSLAGHVIPPGPSDPIKARWMGFWNGSGVHGTEETWSLGHAASHGCIRMSIPDVVELYSMVPLGTPIYVA